MKKSLSRAIAVTAATAAGMAGALVVTPTATADQASAPAERSSSTRLERTGYAYKADVFGSKVLVNGVEVRGLKDGYAQQRCTALAGRFIDRDSLVSIPDDLDDLIDISLTNQTSETYKRGDRTGVRGVSTIGEVVIGGEVPGLGELPAISIKGLTSVADAYNKGGKYGTDESFSFEGLAIDLAQDNEISKTLDALLETLGLEEVPDVINVTANQLLTTIVDILGQGLGNAIVIPGLGEIGLGTTKNKVTSKNAASEAYALKISILEDVAGQPTTLQLGRARTYIGKAGKAGVFRGTATGANLLGDIPGFSLGNLEQRAIPCDGTDGRTITKRAGNFNIAGLIDVTGVKYQYMGDHLRRGRAKALIGTELGSVSIPSVELEIKGLTSLVQLRHRGEGSSAKRKVRRTVTTGFAQVLHKGQPIEIAPGQTYSLGDGRTLAYKVLHDQNKYGIAVHGLSVNLGELGILDLATSAGRIFAR